MRNSPGGVQHMSQLEFDFVLRIWMWLLLWFYSHWRPCSCKSYPGQQKTWTEQSHSHDPLRNFTRMIGWTLLLLNPWTPHVLKMANHILMAHFYKSVWILLFLNITIKTGILKHKLFYARTAQLSRPLNHLFIIVAKQVIGSKTKIN